LAGQKNWGRETTQNAILVVVISWVNHREKQPRLRSLATCGEEQVKTAVGLVAIGGEFYKRQW
jgi:hypothetical protein